MPRRTRKQLLDLDEDQERLDRENGYRALATELHRQWREASSASLSSHESTGLDTGEECRHQQGTFVWRLSGAEPYRPVFHRRKSVLLY
jgi:phage terminase large subunit GpA-like protein